ncbi:hypothetical protein [Mycetohabitans endofungorum]|uniref:hypothetical protein n=1 Tax=Mycetohabitans endofungorum TaxID=417203 RepID=UPI0030CA7371
MWPELALGLSNFSIHTPDTPHFAQRYYALLARLPSLSVAEQEQIIPTMCRLLLKFSQSDPRVPQLHTLLQDYALRLPPSHQGSSAGALGSYIWFLPEAEQPVRYAQVRDWALSLPDDQWAVALRQLPAGLDGLPTRQQEQELALLERHLARVPAAQRVSAALGLLRCVPLMNDTLAQRVWQQGLSLLKGTDEVSCSVSSGKRATTDNNRCAAAHACASTHQRLSRRVDRCLRFFASRMKIVVEPTGYLGFAAAHCVAGRFTSKCIGVLLSGGNMGLDRYAALLAQ